MTVTPVIDQLDAHVRDFGAHGHEAVALPADMADWAQVEAALKRFGSPDILVNNSGGPPPVDVTKVDPDLWRAQFESMVLNQMRLTEAVLPAMRERRFGRILSVASTSIVEPFASLAISNSLRAALAGWMLPNETIRLANVKSDPDYVKIQQLVIIKTSALNQSAYCMSHNVPLGRKIGLTEAQIKAAIAMLRAIAK